MEHHKLVENNRKKITVIKTGEYHIMGNLYKTDYRLTAKQSKAFQLFSGTAHIAKPQLPSLQ